MERSGFRDLLRERVLVLDGSMGALLQKFGLAPGQAPEAFMLERPSAIREVHRAYVEAGADVILTNTFGASPMRLEEFSLAERVREINALAVRTAREAAGDGTLVAGDIGPSGRFLKPVGDLSFARAYSGFLAQARALAESGVDLILIETLSDLREAKAAVLAAREAFSGPIVVHLTFAADGRTVTGTDALTAHTVLTHMDVDGVGVNCSVGPAAMEGIVKTLCEASGFPVSVEPNAGLPVLRDGKPAWPEGDGSLAEYAERFHALGANLIGGCCGTTPRTVAAIAARLKGKSPVRRTGGEGGLRLASRTRTRIFPPGGPCALVGERLNPTGRRTYAERLLEGDFSALRHDALEQVARGADLLDINCGAPGADEAALLGAAVTLADSITDAPLVVDTAHPEALREALEASGGRVLINSATGERGSMDRVFPLARRHGAAVLGLCLDERGIPETARGRLEIGRRILARALGEGLRPHDLVLDPLTLAASADPGGARITLETIRAIREDLGIPTLLGVSNISFGLPARPALNAAFLAQAVAAGLDFAILNPFEEGMVQALRAANLLAGRDPDCRAYSAHFAPRPPEGTPGDDPGPEGAIRQAVIEGDREGIAQAVRVALASGLSASRLTQEGLVRGMETVGERFRSGRVYLPQVLLSAEALHRAFALLRPHLAGDEVRPRGTVVFATVQGDIHDIGKNICSTLLENRGYRVVDLGKDVRAQDILEAAERQGADIIALSSLMTTTMRRLPEIIASGRGRGLQARYLVGGAVVTAAYAEAIGADAYGADAVECVRAADRLMGLVEIKK